MQTAGRTTVAKRPRDASYMERLMEMVALERKDREEVARHAEGVTERALQLGRSLGMGNADLDMLKVATRLHDIGKLKVPDAILRSKGRLEGDDWEQMKRHAMHGAQMLSAIPGIPKIMVDVARYHHERYDGFGYERLKGDEIPFAARIVTIADVHEALTAERSYKAGFSEEVALEMMTADNEPPKMGRHAFDPVMLRTFVRDRMSRLDFEASPEVTAALRSFVQSPPFPEVEQDLGSGMDVEMEPEDQGPSFSR